ncbi:MAG: cupin domain-containing protein [Betaproteobacteria bacterium]|nr:cupin domain-containing protein [Betaproteobacteria bacterium]
MSQKKLLGGLSAARFLREHWQKKPLLIRGAFAPGFEPLTKREVFTLAARDEAESRLISRRGRRWELQHGPIGKRDIAAVGDAPWTILVQDVQHFSAEARQLLHHFDFIPRARVDDLMVSYAVDGGGVGPHLDSYDVFLLQGMGRRRWRISSPADTTLVPDAPVKILSKFRAEQEWILNPGDMLYLPPGVAHEGVALGECLTWSIGFRAPTAAELNAAFMDFLRDEVVPAGQFIDPELAPAVQPTLIDARLTKKMTALLAPVARAARDPAMHRKFLGCYLTEPKAHVLFEPPEKALTAAAFRKDAARHGIALDGRSRLLHDKDRFYLNGEALDIAGADRDAWRTLAIARSLSGAALSGKMQASGLAALHDAYRAGYLHLNS